MKTSRTWFAILAVCAAVTISLPTMVYADGDHGGDDSDVPRYFGVKFTRGGLGKLNAAGHAPIGVMGDHMHGEGELMLSYRYMFMDMGRNQIGREEVSPDFIAANVANPNAPPATFRVVPTDMNMEMHMFGAMYAPTNWLTLMAMGMYVRKEMDHITFQGGAGTNRLGTFTTVTKGFANTKIGGLIKLYNDGTHKIHFNAVVGLPTADIENEARVLAPHNTAPTLRVPYAMQSGSGSFDLHPGLTYNGKYEDWTWGAQWTSEIRTEDNDEGYNFGDIHRVTAWGQYSWFPWMSSSLRLAFETEGRIDGEDDQIRAPIQTADPDNYGGERVFIHGGLNFMGQSGAIRGQRLALEIGAPMYENLNGPQMTREVIITLGWQYAF